MPLQDIMIGLCIGECGVQAVEVDRTGPRALLRAIDEWENTLPTGWREDSPEGTEQFRQYLAAFLKVNKIQTRQVSVALDASYLFLNTLPLDPSITASERTAHVRWELQQYFPEAGAEDFVTAFLATAHDPPEPIPEYLAVSVRRKDSRLLQTTLQSLGLRLDVIDVEHFSGETALRVNYPDSSHHYIALVCVKRNRLDISWHRGSTLEGYRYALVDSDYGIAQEFAKISRDSTGIHSIMAFGPHLDKDLLLEIRHASTTLVEAMNPLRHVNVSESLRLADKIHSPSYRFAAAVGIALRKD
jgi:hypothetical protein